MSQSRRAFLKQASAVAGMGFMLQLPGRHLWAVSPRELLPEPDVALLCELARKAVDAARAAGASFADIRMTAARVVSIACTYDQESNQGKPVMRPPSLDLRLGYGIRTIVDGVWGFASGVELTADAVVQTARAAAAAARATRRRRGTALELAPMPTVENGAWATPIAADPFAVSIREQGELGLAALAEAVKVPRLTSAQLSFQWRRPTSVFAATDGSLIVQQLTLAWPLGRVFARLGPDILSSADMLLDLPVGGYGYEVLGQATLGAKMHQLAERVVMLARAAHAPTPAEVGRLDLVLGPAAVADLLVATAAEAVNAERALGYRANQEGTSFAAPPAEILGKYQVGSTRLSVRADRSQPHGAATVGWDDEGVKPNDYTFVKDGVFVDYHTSRETAAQLADWYHRQGEPVRSHGCFRRMATERPAVQIPNLTILPGAGTTTLDDLIAGTKRGLYVEAALGIGDQQVINTQCWTGHTQVRQIVNGQLGRYVKDMAFQFNTPQFWKSVDAIGGADSMRRSDIITDGLAKDDPRQAFPCSTVNAVPVRVRQVNVLNSGRTG